MDLFAAHTTLAVLSYVVVAVGVIAAVVSVGVIAEFLVRNRRTRLASNDSNGTYYRRLAPMR